MQSTSSRMQRHHFADKDPFSQSYGFSCNHVQMWELDHKEGWVAEELMFLNCGVGEDSWEPLELKEIKLVNLKGNQTWIFIGGTDAEAPVLWPPDVKSWLMGKDSDCGKDCGQEEKGTTEDEMVGCHHWLNGHEFEQTQGDNEGQENLMCCSSCVAKRWTWLSERTTEDSTTLESKDCAWFILYLWSPTMSSALQLPNQ